MTTNQTIGSQTTESTANKPEQQKPNNFKQTKACAVIFFVAFLICLIPGVPSWTALLVGLIFSCAGLVPSKIPVSVITKSLLSYSIVGLGFGLTLQQASEACQNGVMLIMGSIVVTLFIGIIFARLFKLDKKTGLMISSGTAICGGSAISAIAPAINAKDDETSIALATVFSLNAAALVIFPVIGRLLEMTDLQFGLWSAIAIHDTSSVVGAAATYSDNALQIATTVKLVRALFIVPVALIATIIYTGRAGRIRVPNFIVLYIIAVLVCSYVNFDFGLFKTSDIYHSIYEAARRTIVGALFFIGSGITFKKLITAGPKALAFGTLLWIIIGTASLLLIINHY